MANHIPSFLSGAKCVIRIGTVNIAFAQNLSFADDMSVQPVGQIGSYMNQSLEPTGYLARGSISITQYSDHVLTQLAAAGAPAPADKYLPGDNERDGNSMLVKEYFSPAHLILSRDFNIDVYERGLAGGSLETLADIDTNSAILYQIQGCRFTNYSISFSPGQMVTENLSFIARGVQDSRAGEISKI